jgi:hypothetical protein
MEPEPKDKIGIYALSALLAIGVAGIAIFGHSAIAQNQQGNQEEQSGIYSVPDAGSTAALLGLSVALVGLAQRKLQ